MVEGKLRESGPCSERGKLFKVRGPPCRGPHWGRGQEQEERSVGATGWLGLGQAGGGLPTGSSARAIWPRPAKGTTEPGPQGASGPWLVGPAGASAPPQLLQLVGHLLQLRLDGRQALQLLVLGENVKSHTGTGPGSLCQQHGACRQTGCARVSCVALDRWLCLSESQGPHLFRGDSGATLPGCSQEHWVQKCARGTQARRLLNGSARARGKRSPGCPSELLPLPQPQGLDCDDGFLGEAVPGFPVCHRPSYLRGQRSVAQVSGRESCLGLGLHPQSQSLGPRAPAARVVQGSRGPSGTDTHKSMPSDSEQESGKATPQL